MVNNFLQDALCLCGAESFSGVYLLDQWNNGSRRTEGIASVMSLCFASFSMYINFGHHLIFGEFCANNGKQVENKQQVS